jgi:hypothetical protein
MEQVILNLQDVERVIRFLEQKYGMSSEEFLRSVGNPDISEDDDFEWEAYLDHKRNLLEIHAERHRDYVETIKRDGCGRTAEANNQLAFCA